MCDSCSALDRAIRSSSISIPLSLVIEGAVEAFLPLLANSHSEAPSRPMRLLGRGEFVGVFETRDALFGQPTEVPPWGGTAGARS